MPSATATQIRPLGLSAGRLFCPLSYLFSQTFSAIVCPKSLNSTSQSATDVFRPAAPQQKLVYMQRTAVRCQSTSPSAINDHCEHSIDFHTQLCAAVEVMNEPKSNGLRMQQRSFLFRESCAESCR